MSKAKQQDHDDVVTDPKDQKDKWEIVIAELEEIKELLHNMRKRPRRQE